MTLRFQLVFLLIAFTSFNSLAQGAVLYESYGQWIADVDSLEQSGRELAANWKLYHSHEELSPNVLGRKWPEIYQRMVTSNHRLKLIEDGEKVAFYNKKVRHYREKREYKHLINALKALQSINDTLVTDSMIMGVIKQLPLDTVWAYQQRTYQLFRQGEEYRSIVDSSLFNGVLVTFSGSSTDDRMVIVNYTTYVKGTAQKRLTEAYLPSDRLRRNPIMEYIDASYYWCTSKTMEDDGLSDWKSYYLNGSLMQHRLEYGEDEKTENVFIEYLHRGEVSRYERTETVALGEDQYYEIVLNVKGDTIGRSFAVQTDTGFVEYTLKLNDKLDTMLMYQVWRGELHGWEIERYYYEDSVFIDKRLKRVHGVLIDIQGTSLVFLDKKGRITSKEALMKEANEREYSKGNVVMEGLRDYAEVEAGLQHFNVVSVGGIPAKKIKHVLRRIRRFSAKGRR